MKDKITNLYSFLDSVIGSINEIMNAEFKKNFGNTLTNLNKTTKSLTIFWDPKKQNLKETLENINKFSKMLSDNSGKMDKTFTNLETYYRYSCSC